MGRLTAVITIGAAALALTAPGCSGTSDEAEPIAWRVPGSMPRGDDPGELRHYTVRPDRDSLLIEIGPTVCTVGGSPPIDRIDVDEGVDAVTITARARRRGTTGSPACQSFTRERVELTEPLGNRALLVGGFGKPREARIDADRVRDRALAGAPRLERVSGTEPRPIRGIPGSAREALERWLIDVREGRIEAACTRMTRRGRGGFAYNDLGLPEWRRGRGCEETVRLTREQVSSAWQVGDAAPLLGRCRATEGRRPARALEIVIGDRAVGFQQLCRADGGWEVSSDGPLGLDEYEPNSLASSPRARSAAS